MILDAATSSIDTRTEMPVQEGMDRLMNGRMIERGSHDQLIGEKGTYYQLYTGKAAG